MQSSPWLQKHVRWMEEEKGLINICRKCLPWIWLFPLHFMYCSLFYLCVFVILTIYWLVYIVKVRTLLKKIALQCKLENIFFQQTQDSGIKKSEWQGSGNKHLFQKQNCVYLQLLIISCQKNWHLSGLKSPFWCVLNGGERTKKARFFFLLVKGQG